jgi:hypothetical protein
MAEFDVSPKSIEAGYELSDLRPKTIALFALILTVTLFVVFLVTYEMARDFHDRQASGRAPTRPYAQRREPLPTPRLWVTPAEELKAMRSAEDAILHSYAWVDKQNGIARIPIERAMEWLAEKTGKQKAAGSGRRSEGKQ